MADPYAIELTMAQNYQGRVEEFSNIWHYDQEGVPLADSDWSGLGDALVNIMKPVFSPLVTFKRFRVYGPTNLTKVESVMRVVKDVNLPGTSASGAKFSPELAFVGWVYMGRGPKGGKQILRKYLHTLASPETTESADALLGRAVLSSTGKASIAAALNSTKNLTYSGITLPICNEDGKHLPLGSNWAVLDYLHTRQFRRGHKRKVPA